MSINFDELLAARLVVEEAKKAWEEEKNHAFKWKRRVVASYKESEGFQCSFWCSSQATYEFWY